MRGKIAAAMLSIMAALFGESACAMNSPVPASRCQVVGASQLPADIGGPDARCSAIEQALQAAAPKPAGVEVNVISPYLLSATVSLADGRRLPASKVGRSEHQLGARAVQMLADSIAAQVAARQTKHQ
jgi:hypothetical protein